MCNLYCYAKSQYAARAPARVERDIAGNIPRLMGIFGNVRLWRKADMPLERRVKDQRNSSARLRAACTARLIKGVRPFSAIKT